MNTGQLTEKQAETLNAITELMREHFDAAVFIFEVDAADDNAPKMSHMSWRTCGLHSSALGLLEYARDRILKEP